MTAPRTPRERVPYSAIVDRAPLKLPGGARMVVWTIVNVEDWGIERPMPRTILPPPMGQPLLPDLPNWAWHEYGMRVGFWRLLDCMRKFKVTPTLAINGIVCKTYPRVAQAAKEAGWEFMGHGYVQMPMHKVEDQKKAIGDTIAAIRDVTGKPPKGWESPGLTETADTIDHLAEAGIEYVANWVLDDQPVWIDAAPRKVVSVPYSLEVNDIAMMVIQNHTASELLVRGRHYFDRLYEESAKTTRVMAIAVHPYLTGTPHRIHYLEELYTHILDKPGVVHCTGGEIADWFRADQPQRR